MKTWTTHALWVELSWPSLSEAHFASFTGLKCVPFDQLTEETDKQIDSVKCAWDRGMNRGSWEVKAGRLLPESIKRALKMGGSGNISRPSVTADSQLLELHIYSTGLVWGGDGREWWATWVRDTCALVGGLRSPPHRRLSVRTRQAQAQGGPKLSANPW